MHCWHRSYSMHTNTAYFQRKCFNHLFLVLFCSFGFEEKCTNWVSLHLHNFLHFIQIRLCGTWSKHANNSIQTTSIRDKKRSRKHKNKCSYAYKQRLSTMQMLSSIVNRKIFHKKINDTQLRNALAHPTTKSITLNRRYYGFSLSEYIQRRRIYVDER